MTGGVFVSYSSADRAYVHRLTQHLENLGFDVWYDTAIDRGDLWQQTIKARILSAGAMVVVMTPESDSSGWVTREINLAHQCKIPILSLLLRGERFFSLNDLQEEDVRGGALPSSRFTNDLRSKLNSSEQQPPPRTRTPHEPPPSPSTRKGVAGPVVAIVAIGLAIAGILSATIPRGSSGGSDQRTSAAAPPVDTSTTSPPSTLPSSADPTFNVNSSFQGQKSTISGSFGSSGNDDVTVDARLENFELKVAVTVAYSEESVEKLKYYNNGLTERLKNGELTVESPGPDYGVTSYRLHALKSELTASGSTARGTLTFSGVLNGKYLFQPVGFDRQIELGSTTTPNFGASYGGSLDSGLTVYAVRRSSSDTVIVYGAATSTASGTVDPITSSCVVAGGANPSDNTATVIRPTGGHTDRQITRERGGYLLGSLLFSPAIPGNVRFYYKCDAGGSPTQTM